MREFYGMGFHALLAAYEKAVREGTVMVSQTLRVRDHGKSYVMGIDMGSPGGDHTVFAVREGPTIETIIIDDPYGDAHTFEGEFREVKLERAQAIVPKNRGPLPRTKYPRRR